MGEAGADVGRGALAGVVVGEELERGAGEGRRIARGDEEAAALGGSGRTSLCRRSVPIPNAIPIYRSRGDWPRVRR